MNNLAVIIVTMILSAFFSGVEIAFITSNKLKIEIDKGKGLLSARIISHFTKAPQRLIGAVLIGNNIALVLYSIAMANLLNPPVDRLLPGHLHSEFLVMIIQTIVATIIILLISEFLPKALFRINPNAILQFFAMPVWIFYYLLYPFVYIFTGISEWILRKLFRVKFTREEKVFSPVDLDEYIREFAKDEDHMDEGKQEIMMFQNVLEFRNVKLRECMLPRTEIIAVEKNDPVKELKGLFIEHGLSRILVYDESIDNIIGYAHSFDMFRNPGNIISIIKPILFVPETIPANIVLTQFIREGKNIAVVVDEFGGTSGMVTMEDIIEEIFGEIEDEFDDEDLVEKVISDKEFIFSARLEIDYVNDKYRLKLPESDDYETLAGLIIYFHESIPAVNETILVKPYAFDILEAGENRIDLVRVRVEED